ncbi:MAG: RDD family protein [Bacillota bacterium]|jgi:uncharacterized RDD family membrane protein YckC|nr:RDD family protein [Bacillota bacterium]HOF65586.1 RDD family protein [Bacilli bacterium]
MKSDNPLYKKHPNEDIVAAPFGRRLLAALIDLLISVAFAFLTFTVFENIFYNTTKGRAINTNFYEVKKASLLYGYNDERELLFPYQDREGQELATTRFYTVANINGEQFFRYEKCSFYNEYVAFDFGVHILEVNSESSLYVKIVDEEDNVTYTVKEGVSEESLVSFWDKKYNEALQNLTNMPFYREANKPYRDIFFYGSWGSFVIGAIPPYLILPLIFKNGLTLGKYLFGIALCDKDGYQIKVRHVIVRYLVYSVIEVGSAFRALFIPLFLSSAVVTLDKQNRAAHDIAARTYVCDAYQSKIFASKQDQSDFYNPTLRKEDRDKITYWQLPKRKPRKKTKEA